MSFNQKIRNWIGRKYLFVIRREEDFSVITSLSITKIKTAMLLFFFLVCCFVLALISAKTFLANWFDPLYQESENTKRIFALSETVDSLVMEVQAKDRYLNNLQRIIAGEDEEDTSIMEEEQPDSAEGAWEAPDLFKSSEATQSIIKEFETMSPDERSFTRLGTSSFMETYFFSPIKGVVTGSFKLSEDHYGVDIVSAENEPVKAVADGTVIFASWTLETGYVIGIQHSNELISIYKHNSVLLKTIGEPVSGGEVISVIGNTGEQTTGQHLHFELWYRGNPLNPQEFITFD